jgi:hypothetical protein
MWALSACWATCAGKTYRSGAAGAGGNIAGPRRAGRGGTAAEGAAGRAAICRTVRFRQRGGMSFMGKWSRARAQRSIEWFTVCRGCGWRLICLVMPSANIAFPFWVQVASRGETPPKAHHLVTCSQDLHAGVRGHQDRHKVEVERCARQPNGISSLLGGK